MIKESRSKALDEELRELWLDMLHAEQQQRQVVPAFVIQGPLPHPDPGPQLTSAFNGMATHCPTCKAEYKHFAHPRTGAVMTSTCECKFRYVSDGNGNTIVFQEPPVSAG